jgi:hypothetical protein
VEEKSAELSPVLLPRDLKPQAVGAGREERRAIARAAIGVVSHAAVAVGAGGEERKASPVPPSLGRIRPSR